MESEEQQTTSWQGNSSYRGYWQWQSEPNVGRVAARLPVGMDDVERLIDKRKCAKQTTVAVIMKEDKFWVGSNWCENPQEKCPREGLKTGEGYELCKTICKQYSHAEIDACEKAGKNAEGANLYLIGHYYCCDNCIEIMNQYGIKSVHIQKDTENRVDRLKGLGNAIVPQVAYEIFKAIENLYNN